MPPMPGSIASAVSALKSGAVTSEQLMQFALARKAAAIKAGLNCFVACDVNEDKLLEAARQSDDRRAQGRPLGPLDGLPFTVKDSFCVRDHVTSSASRILSTFKSPYTAHCVANLQAQGALLIGRTNMDEFGMGSASSFSRFGPVSSPYSPRLASSGSNTDDDLTAGGSSGGGAAAVAFGAGVFAVGSDTGGSVRQPAAFCGTVGFKPSYGFISRHGLIAYASSLDCPGAMARTVSDAAAVVGVMGSEGATTDDRYAGGITRSCDYPTNTADLRDVTIGVPAEYHLAELDDNTVATWKQGMEWLKDAGAKVVTVSLPWTRTALPTYYTIAPAEASSNLSRYDGMRYGQRDPDVKPVPSQGFHALYTNTRSKGFGREVHRRIMMGTFVLSESQRAEYFDAAVRARSLISADFAAVFQSGVTALLTPTTPTLPWKVADTGRVDPLDMYANDVMTVPASLAGLPAMSVPVGFSASGSLRLPTGLQVIGDKFKETDVVRVAAVLEARAQFHEQVPSHIRGD